MPFRQRLDVETLSKYETKEHLQSMQTTRSVLNDRSKKKTSTSHKICTYEHSTPYFHSDRPHGYEFSHIKSTPEQLVFHKQEVRPTPISLPTPPASPEFYGTSLQKWYQKKPLFTLTAKGQVKRLEKYLQIQRTLEICKREYAFQIHRENMKKEFEDFQFRELQPFLYETNDIEAEQNSSKNNDVGFNPIDYRTSSKSQSEFCMCSDEYDDGESEINYPPSFRNSYFFDIPVEVRSVKTSFADPFKNQVGGYTPQDSNIGEKVATSEVIKQETCNLDDRGILKIIVKNKGSIKVPESKHLYKLFSNQNFPVENKSLDFDNSDEFQVPYHENGKKFGMANITLDNVASFPFDNVGGKCNDSHLMEKMDTTVRYLCNSTPTKYTIMNKKKYTTSKHRYDFNKNEVYYI